MKRLFLLLICGILTLAYSNQSVAQMFDADRQWEDDERTLITAKWSQLFYELNVGFNVSRTSRSWDYKADFLYLGFGVGYPVNTENAWRKFLPAQKIPDNEEEAELFGSMDTKSVWGGKIGLGWIHYFNHAVGFYTQLSWAFLGDFGSGASTTDTTAETESQTSKNTFIYNTVPIEAGVCVNMWKHLHAQCGVMYMWKEIPLLTIGVGANF